MIKCMCGGKIWSMGTNRYVCDNDNCKKKYMKISHNRLNSFEDLKEIE